MADQKVEEKPKQVVEDSSSEESEEDDWIPFSKRPEWADVQPVPQDDGPYPICPINYSEQFRETMDYFRAIILKDERSERALQLTNEAIELNAANYTAWYFRRLCLFALGSDLKSELHRMIEVALDNSKNYQVWYHRRLLLEKLKADPDAAVLANKELELTAMALKDDNKNYHAWSHRQWVLSTFKVWDKELDYIESLIKLDWRNNSAWNQRYFVLTSTTDMNNDLKAKEIEFAIKWIKTSPNNSSPWTYMLGLVKDNKFSDFPMIAEFCNESKNKYVTCAHLFSTLIDICEEEYLATKDGAKLTEALGYCDLLANSIDELRKKYWLYKKGLLSDLK
jgi:protein farnesyltransferase/geranylgeranyltransferase type-1 subunit alpha